MFLYYTLKGIIILLFIFVFSLSTIIARQFFRQSFLGNLCSVGKHSYR